jgi:hypothetical protein
VVLAAFGCREQSEPSEANQSSADEVETERAALLDADFETGFTIFEVSLAVNPNNRNQLAISSFCGVQMSLTGPGGFGPVIDPPRNNEGCANDPSLAFDSQGRLFSAYLGPTGDAQPGPAVVLQQFDVLTGTALDTAGVPCGASGSTPADCPIDITARVGLPDAQGYDKEWIAIDTNPASPFRDRIYVIWGGGNFQGGGGSTAFFAFSDNQGKTWTMQVLSSSSAAAPPGVPNDGKLFPFTVAVAANGDVYAAFHAAKNFLDGPKDSRVPDHSAYTAIYHSTTGGTFDLANRSTFITAPTSNAQECVCSDQQQADGTCQDAGSATPSQTPCPRRLGSVFATLVGDPQAWIVPDPLNPANVVVVYSDDPTPTADGPGNDDLDVRIARSSDFGATWAISTVPAQGNGPLQLFPNAAGLAGSRCLTVSYYNTNTALTGVRGGNLLDVFTIVSPDLGLTWFPPVRVNDAPFDPGLFGGDYLGPNPLPNPATWIPTPRMGEYFGLVHAAGVVWTGNTSTSNQLFADYSDGTPPVVATPAPVTVSTCRPTAAALGSTTATDVCGMPPLSTPAPALGVLSRGANTVQWTARDGANNVGTASQSVTVNDTTPPTLTAPPSVDVSQCAAGTVTVGVPSGSDDCGGAVTFTGQAISKNGVALNPPINVVGGQVSLGAGTYVIRWTASDGTNTSAPVLQTVTVRSRIQAAGSFTVDDSAFIKNADGSPGQVLNSGNGQTHLGVSATSGAITSVASVDLANNARVTGNVTTAGTITAASTAIVTGTRTQHASVVLPPLPGLPAFPAPTGGDVTVNSGSRTLTPGSYGTVTLNSGATLVMTAGDFFMQSLFINSGVNVRVQVTPDTHVFVQSQMAFRSPFVNGSGTLQPILLGFAGSALTVETTFSGTLLAPNGSVTFGIGSGVNYHGSFFGKNLEVRNNSTLTCDDAAARPLPGLPQPGSCSNGVKDGNETDVDCGGSCAACANGRACLANADCQSARCVNGVCQAQTGSVSASLSVSTDWGSGYCVTLHVTNSAAQPTSTWSVTVNTGQSTIYDHWNGNFPAATGTFAITPQFTWNQAIAPGATDSSVGFCANRTPANSGALPVVVSATGTF